jgi:hypothetical protein
MPSSPRSTPWVGTCATRRAPRQWPDPSSGIRSARRRTAPESISCVPAARSERADGPMTGNPDKSICLQVVNKLPGNTP